AVSYLEHGAYEDADHVSHEGVGRDPEAEDVAFLVPAGVVDVAVEADVVGLGWSEGGEVVVAGEGRGAGLQRIQVDGVRPPEGAALLERARRGAREQPVAVAARLGVVPRVEAVFDLS